MLYFNTSSATTQAQVNPFTYQYFFESTSHYFLAIKNHGAGVASNDHQWLMIKKSDLKASALNLRFVDSSNMVEERYFEEGYLKFNPTSGTYIEKYNSAQYSLKPISSVAIPASVHEAVTDFIS